MRKISLYAAVAVFACVTAWADPVAEIIIPGQRLFTESLTSTADGSVLVGAITPGAVFRAKPGEALAEMWIRPGTDGLGNVLGVFADEKSNSLWVCSFPMDAGDAAKRPSALHSFDLLTGAPKGKWLLPSANAMCNDIAVDADGTAFITDSNNMEVLRLLPGAKSLEVWAGNGAFGPKGGVLDGIAIVQRSVVVNALETSKLFSVSIESDGASGPVLEVKLDRALKSPDGQRSFGEFGLLAVDAAEGGRLVQITLSGKGLGIGTVRTLKSGFQDGPVSVTVVGPYAYVLEAQFAAWDKPHDKLRPFKATAVAIFNTSANACPANDTGLELPRGFCGNVFADGIGHARHLAVAANGVVYVNTWSGEYYGNDIPHAGGFIVALQDTQGFGKADTIRRFGETTQSSGAGGTGIALYKDYLYAEINDRIVRYRIAADEIMPRNPPEVVVSGLPIDGEHPMHPFAIDSDGMLYVDVATATNSCQLKNRELKSPGLSPCKELERRGGIWRFDANRLGQKPSAAERFVSGIRNAGAIAIDSTGAVFATQHGRDQLAENWPNLYSPQQGAALPAEELLRIEKGGLYGWPECYYDPAQGKLVLAPEYGGDGGKKVGVCAKRNQPVAAFPAHWAPTALAFYQGSAFPARYREGAFVAFHGSWNRAPFPQGGYNVVFQPMKDGKATDACEIFADGFAGPVKSPEAAEHRPAGLAVGPDGALFVSDDVRGRIYRIVYHGDSGSTRASQRVACPSAAALPESDASIGTSKEKEVELAVPPPGMTQEVVKRGGRLYRAEGISTSCIGCHGAQGKGSVLGPDLTDSTWLWSDGSVKGVARTITEGVSRPKNFRNPMPAMGGSALTTEQAEAIAAYLWSLNR